MISWEGDVKLRNFFVEDKIERLTYIIEMVITVLLAIGIIIGLVDLIKYFREIMIATPAESYDLFQDFLGYALILIVGVELILMILYHSTKSILELVLFVIARKMLIYAHNMTDLVLGTLAIAIVFATLKYLVQKNDQDIVRRGNAIYSASTRVKDILNKTGFDIPTDKGETVGGLVCNLADEACRPIEEGAEFSSGDYKIKIIKSTEDGLIEEVMISSNSDKDDESKIPRDTFKKIKNMIDKRDNNNNNDNDYK